MVTDAGSPAGHLTMTPCGRRASAALLATLLVVSALLGATGSAAAVSQVAGSPDLAIIAPENRLVAGTETAVEVFVVNSGTVTKDGPEEYEALVQTARALTISGDSRGPITVLSGEIPVGTVPEGVSGPVSLRLRVAEDARPGTYDIPVTFTYDYTASVFVDGDDVDASHRSRTVTRDLEVVVERRPAFEVRAVDAALAVGDSGTLAIDIENVGPVGAADATVTVASTNPEITFGSGVATAETFVGEWDAGATERVEFRTRVADDAIVRDYSVELTVSYRDEDGQARTSRAFVAGVRPTRGADFELADVGLDQSRRCLPVDLSNRVAGDVLPHLGRFEPAPRLAGFVFPEAEHDTFAAPTDVDLPRGSGLDGPRRCRPAFDCLCEQSEPILYRHGRLLEREFAGHRPVHLGGVACPGR